MLISPPHTDYQKQIFPSGLYATTLTNCTAPLILNATIDELTFDIDSSGVGSAVIDFLFQIPDNFKKFAGLSDDVSLQAIQNAGADVDADISIDVLDDSGADADDDTVANTALTGSFATYDCAITGGTFVAGDYIIVKITIVSPDADDDCEISIPKLKYIPQ